MAKGNAKDFERLAKEFGALKNLMAHSERYLMAEVSKRLSTVCEELAGIAETMEAP